MKRVLNGLVSGLLLAGCAMSTPVKAWSLNPLNALNAVESCTPNIVQRSSQLGQIASGGLIGIPLTYWFATGGYCAARALWNVRVRNKPEAEVGPWPIEEISRRSDVCLAIINGNKKNILYFFLFNAAFLALAKNGFDGFFNRR